MQLGPKFTDTKRRDEKNSYSARYKYPGNIEGPAVRKSSFWQFLSDNDVVVRLCWHQRLEQEMETGIVNLPRLPAPETAAMFERSKHVSLRKRPPDTSTQLAIWLVTLRTGRRWVHGAWAQSTKWRLSCNVFVIISGFLPRDNVDWDMEQASIDLYLPEVCPRWFVWAVNHGHLFEVLVDISNGLCTHQLNDACIMLVTGFLCCLAHVLSHCLYLSLYAPRGLLFWSGTLEVDRLIVCIGYVKFWISRRWSLRKPIYKVSPSFVPLLWWSCAVTANNRGDYTTVHV